MRSAQETLENQEISEPGAAKASVPLWPPMIADDDLRAVVDAWPTLPAAMRVGILAMISATKSGP
jgi:hypothetical protein